MKPIEHIRKNLFRVSQAVFGDIAGTTQASISRWENGELEPGRAEMARIREEALARGIEWDDRFFFEAPAHTKPEAVARHADPSAPAGEAA